MGVKQTSPRQIKLEAAELFPRIADALSQGETFQAMAKQVVAVLADCAGADALGFWLADEEKPRLNLLVEQGFSRQMRRAITNLSTQNTLAGLAFTRKEIVTSNDASNDERIEPEIRQIVKKQKLKHVICIPFLFQSEALGVINIVYKKPVQLDEAAPGILLAVGKTLGLAIANHRQIERNTAEIAARRQAEITLQASEERFRELYQNAPVAYVSITADGLVAQANLRAAELMECALDEFVGSRMADYYAETPANKKSVPEFTAALLRGETIKNQELEIRTAKGNHLWLSISMQPVIDDNGRLRQTRAAAIDITEQKKAEAEAQANYLRYERLVNATLEGVLIHDNGRILEANPAFCQMFGYTAEELAGKDVIELIAPESRETARQYQTQLTDKKYELTGLRKDGSTFPIEVNVRMMPHQSELARIVAVQDISERKQLENQIRKSLARREREVRLSTQIAQEITTASDLNELYSRVVTQVQEQFGYYYTQLLRYDAALDSVALIEGYGDVGRQMKALNHSVPLGVGLVGTAAATGQPLLRPNVLDDPAWQANPLLPHTKGELAVPIKLKNKVLGVLDVQSDEAGRLDENDQLVLEGLCGQIAIAIESITLRQEMEDRLRELAALQRQMSQTGWRLYRSEKQRAPGYRYDHSGVTPLSPAPETAAVPAANGDSNQADERPLAGETLPLTVRGEEIGVIGVADETERPLSEEEKEFLEAVSKEVAEALEAARLFEQTQEALAAQEKLATELETVAQVSTAASTILDVDALLQAVVDLAKSSFNLYHAHIYLMHENNTSLVLKAGAGNIGRLMTLEGREIDIYADSLVARAARTREGVIANDVRKTVDFLPHPLLPHTRSELAVPMIVGDKLVGILDLQSDKLNFFSEDDLKTQKTLASQIAVAIENAQQYAEQVRTAEKLREVDLLKSEFLASMSHELRTPLNSIIGFADVLLEGLDGELNERMEEDVRLIRNSGAHLRNLIGDILDMSKIESGRMELRYEEINLPEMAEDIMALAAPLAQEKNLLLHMDIGENVNTILADRTRLRQILWNIMGNAIKFTQEGSVTLSMQDKTDHLLVAIRDTGIGIKEEHIPIVFEQFRQVDGSLNRTAGGTGLGMPITKKLVELHGGKIWIESVYGQGSTFFFTIPHTPAPAASQTREATAGV